MPHAILEARSRIDRTFLDSPTRESAALNRRLGLRTILKDETVNPIRSFKGRGACNLLHELRDVNHVVCASAGNFGQGLAWAARARGVGVTVFASEFANRGKIAAMQRLGAEVVLHGVDFDAAKAGAREYALRHGLHFVEDGGDPAIAEGAGTIAAELTNSDAQLDAVLVPLGNGSLASGIGCWMRYARPHTRVVAVAAAGAPATAESVRNGVLVETGSVDTIADGLAVRCPVPYAVRTVRNVVDEVVLVSDEHMERAMVLLLAELSITVEPAGAAGVACLLAAPERWRGQTVATPLCGGNR